MACFKKTFLIVSLLLLFINSSFAQAIIQNDEFKYVPLLNNKVIFQKEIILSDSTTNDYFPILKEWARLKYDSDLKKSNVRYDSKNEEIIIKSNADILLPKDESRFQNSISMSYHLNAFIFDNKCVLEIRRIQYKYYKKSKKESFIRFKAENFITDKALLIDDQYSKLRADTKKETLKYLNEIANSLKKELTHRSEF